MVRSDIASMVRPSRRPRGRSKAVKWLRAAYGAALLGLAAFFAFMPRMTAFGVGVLLGIGLVLVGVLGFIALPAERRLAGVLWRGLWATAALITGICVLVHPWPGVLSLTLLLGLGLVAQGLAAVGQALVHRRAYGRGASWLLAGGGLGVALGALVLAWSPALGAMLPALFFAVTLFIYGADVMASAFESGDGAGPSAPSSDPDPLRRRSLPHG